MDTIPQDNTPRKQCNGPCGRILPFTSEFFHGNGKDRHGKSILRPECRECRSGKARAYYGRPGMSEQRNAYAKVYRTENQERIQVRKKEYARRPGVKEHKRNYTQVYRTRPGVQEKKREQAKEYVSRPEVQEKRRPYDRTFQHNRRARLKENGGSHTPKQIQEQFTRQKGKCYYCRVKMEKYQIDHVVPVSKGGSNDISNIVLACPPCNQQKNDRLPHQWPEGGRLL